MAKDRKIDMVILGLLSHENLTGYDIKKRIDNAIGFFWKGSFGSIYPSLASLTDSGSIIKVETPDIKDGRERILYAITQTGKEQLLDWLSDTKAVNDLKYESLLKLFFGGVTDCKVSINTIESFRSEIQSSLSILRFYQNNLQSDLNNNDHLFYYLTVSFGVETYEAYLRWCDFAVKILCERNNL